MAVSDSIADVMTRIRNAQMLGRDTVTVPLSHYTERFLNVLCDEGYISHVDKILPRSQGCVHGALRVFVKYVHGKAVISEIKKVSRPGRRVYVKHRQIPRVRNGLGIAILSTSRGLMTDYEARSQNLGGELLCTVF